MPKVPTETLSNVFADFTGHLRVLGPPGSGKTQLLLESYRRAERAVVITYTRESRDAVTAELLDKGSARFGNTPVYTYHKLASHIVGAANASVGLRVVGELEEAVLLRRVLRQIQGNLKSDFRNTVHSRAFQGRILGVLNTMLQNGVGVQHRDRLMASSDSPRLRDLYLIYFNFIEYLGSRGLYSFYDAAWRAAKMAAENPGLNPLQDVDVVLVDDFNDVDGGQYALLNTLVPPDSEISLRVFGDPTGARFRDKGTTDRYLLEVFPADYQPRDVRLPAGCANEDSLGVVVDTLLVNTVGEGSAREFGRRSRAAGADGTGVAVSLATADDEVAEAAHLARRAAELIASGDFRPEDISVAARDMSRYEPVLSAAFRDRGLVLDSGRRPQHPFEFFVASLLRLLDEPRGEFARNALSKSPYYDPLTGVCRRIEGDVVSPDKDLAVDMVREAIQRTAVDRKGGFDLEPLMELWLRPVLAGAGADAAPELLAFLGSLVEEWHTYTEAVTGTAGRRTIREFIGLSRTLSPRAVGARSGVGRVGLFSIHELSARRSPVVFLAGCSELIFPAVPPREDYVPWGALQNAIRREITDRPIELFEARASTDFLRDEYALMLTSLSRATERLELTAPLQVAGHSTPAPARVLNSIPDGATTRGVGRQPPIAARFFAAIVNAGVTPPPAGNLAADLWHRQLPPERPVPREHGRLSPSSLTTFTVCHRKYFYSRVLRLEGARSAALAFGTAFHDLLNRLATEHRTHEELSAVIRSRRLDGMIEEVVSGTDGFADASEMEKNAARHHLREMTFRFLELDGARRDGYRVESCEQYLQFEHGGSHFHGVADRIDRTGAGASVVIDYKTGKLPKTGKTIRKKALAGFPKPEERLWQVPIYVRGASGDDGSYPQTFCYYVIRPDGDDAVVGLVVGDEAGAEQAAESFGVAKNRIASITRKELDESLDEAAEVARDVLTDRAHFVRTTELNRCPRCDFRRVCERTT
jgi:superfamily I DNA/RNA helicase/CRISPR/Cas system-associated exonuclease Cas4 (RecB family)